MRISITKSELIRTLSIVSRGMASHSTLALLTGVHIDATEPKQAIFQTTDLENSVRCAVPAFVEEPGETVVPGKLFENIVKSLPDAAVLLTSDNQSQLEVLCGDASFSLNTLDPADFPQFPAITPEQTATLPLARLQGMVEFVARSISRDEHRLILTGINMKIEENKVTLVTTDSYRLALCEATLQSPVAESFEAVLPGNLFRDIIKAAADADEISIGIADSQLVFTFGDTEYVTRRIEGTYPNYSAVLPSSHKTTAVVDTEALTAAVRQASLLSQSGSSISLAFSKEDQNIHVSSQSQDVGQASVYVDAQIEGLDLTTAYNHQYLLDGLSSIKSEKTLLEFESANRPGILRPTSQDKALYLVMPVRLG